MNLKTELRPMILIALVAFVVFANSLGGDFVYDDTRQILRNPLIQDSNLYGKALTSDVWAFKGDGSVAASNYFRPTFVAWLILNFKVFGTSPFGWHLTNLLLHIGVCLLAFLLLRRWNVSQNAAFAVALIFAVHPVHTESVAWISGSPDLLFAAAFLGSLIFADKWTFDRKPLDIILSVAFYALALGAKEIALLCLPIYFLIFRERLKNAENAQKSGQFLSSPFNSTAIFAVVAAAFFAIRWSVLGKITLPVEDAPNFTSAVLSVPPVFVFYLKQIFFPLTLGVNYPLRPVTEIGLTNFFLPLAISAAVFAALLLACRKSFLRQIGAALFLLPLLPVLNVASFPFDQIVHDRYLYLPLFGLLIVVFSLLDEFFKPKFAGKSETFLVALGIILAIPLSLQTFFYNQVWKNNLALWSHNARIDTASATTFVNYAAELSGAGRYAEAVEAYNRSLENRPTALAYMGRARNLMALKRNDEAIRDLETAINLPPDSLNAYTLYQSFETLALIYTSIGDFAKAEANLREARRRLPIYSAALSEKLAVVLYQKGDKTAALAELEAAQKQARTELLPESKAVLLRLGMLYAELNRKAEAKAVLQDYLTLTANLKDNVSLADRRQAANLLRSLQ
jgi:tetratricopeptide (TPR) repeat protein